MNLELTDRVGLRNDPLSALKSARKAMEGSLRPTIRRDIHLGDRIFRWVLRFMGIAVILLLIAIGTFLTFASLPSIKEFGWRFLNTSTWDPVRDVFGAMPLVYGTLVSSFLALLISVPLSVGVALFIVELAPKRVGKAVGFLIEMLAAIPSVVYGLWGIFVLAPFLRTEFQPKVIEYFGSIPLFAGPAYGVGMFAAALILSVMITPTISSISREVFRAIPRSYREAAIALGATRWETIKVAVLKTGRAGVFGAVVLGLGRALGETMAVTMLIGNRSQISASLFAPAQTMASAIANEYVEATSDIHLAALAEVGLVLFGVTFVVNAIARIIIRRVATRGES